jgi:hypothetical protein
MGKQQRRSLAVDLIVELDAVSIEFGHAGSSP